MKDKVIGWMEEAGRAHTGKSPADEDGIIRLFEFVAKKSAEHEREACAKLCDSIKDRHSIKSEATDANARTKEFREAEACGAEDCAEAIRARGAA